jgi:2-dehydro-3-deoxygluconokinase
VTGITPALSASAAEVALEAAKTAQAMGVTISCDLNFRAKLWKYGKTAKE